MTSTTSTSRDAHAGYCRRAGIGLALIGVVLAGTATVHAVEQEVFATPKAAAKALVAAVKSGNESKLLAIFGSQSEEVVSSGDPVADRTSRQRFVSDAEQRTRVEASGNTATLLFGDSDWPFPIPLVRAGDGWRFDTAAGKDELLSRRIGRNELQAIATCRAYVQAQREFAHLTRDATGQPVYAQRLASEPGTHDGLYWPVKAGEPPSPMGPLMAEAASAGYDPAGGSPAPYHGYFFKILTAQGANAPGGARSFVENGVMVGGFALLAYPATSGASGIMTFVVDRQGIVFQKNLGPETDNLAPAITAYDPDPSWDPVD